MDTHPDIEERLAPPKNSWLSEHKAVEVYNDAGGLAPSPTITLSSTDPVHISKALCVIASAHQYRNTGAIVCGAPATLSRKRWLWCNGLISARNGDVWHDSLVPRSVLCTRPHSDVPLLSCFIAGFGGVPDGHACAGDARR
jgi:hypothetical protein